MINKMYTTEKVIPLFKKYGYEYVYGESDTQYSKVTICDEEGYLYYAPISPLIHKKNRRFSIFGNGNPYTIENINRFILLQGLNSQLISNQYINSSCKLQFKCLECGQTYYKSWGKFQSSNGVCNDCSFKISSEKTKLTIQEVNSRLAKNGWRIQKGERYRGNNKNMNVVNNLGYMAKTSLANIESAKNDIDIFNIRNPYTIKNIKTYMKLNHMSAILISDKYEGYSRNLTWKCECGTLFERSLATMFTKKSLGICERCLLDRASESYRMDVGKIYDICKSKKYHLLSTNYTNQKSKLKVEDEEGYLYNINIETISNAETPQKFSKLNIYRMHNILVFIKNNNLNVKLLFKNYHEQKREKLDFECECGETFTTTIENFIYANKTRCSKCNNSISNLELKTRQYLDNENIVYESQKTYEDLLGVGGYKLRYDFYLPNHNTLLEVQGSQHYVSFEYFGGKEKFEIRKEHDNRKKLYARNNNIKLVEIPYWLFKDNSYVTEIRKAIGL